WEGTLAEDAPLPTKVDRSDEWIPQVTAGAEITFKIGDIDTLSLGVEGFYNGLGYDDPDLYPCLFLQGDLQFFCVGRAYGAAYAYLPAPGSWQHVSFTGSWISNLSDETSVTRLDVSWVVLTELALNAYGQVHFGDQGEFAYSVELPGYTSVMATVEIGVGARIDF